MKTALAFKNEISHQVGFNVAEGIFHKLLSKEKKLAVVGLGYVGLPIALEFAKDFSVIGFDINKYRVELMKGNEDPSNELTTEEFEEKEIRFTYQERDLLNASFFVVAVPTPINENNEPDLGALIGATTSVARYLKKGNYVVFESTVYPGCTEEICVPILEQYSGLKAGVDFKVGYSPERINPGDKVNTITKIKKIVSGCDAESLEQIAAVYGHIIEAGIHQATSIKVAEAAKIVENTQRDINIGLMNELSTIFEKLDINTFDVLEAAGTKWNFLKFYPGLVGGHCIGVDPYYLIDKSREVGVEPKIIAASRKTNDEMPHHIARKLVSQMIESGRSADNSRVLVQGITFKENVSDIRNSKAADLVKHLAWYGVEVDVIDPMACPDEVEEEYAIQLKDQPSGKYDAVVVAVSHQQFQFFGADYYNRVTTKDALVFDLKNTLAEDLKGITKVTL